MQTTWGKTVNSTFFEKKNEKIPLRSIQILQLTIEFKNKMKKLCLRFFVHLFEMEQIYFCFIILCCVQIWAKKIEKITFLCCR